MRFNILLAACCATGSFFLASSIRGEVVLGIGNSALLGGDLTDPENNGDPENDVNYNAVFASSSEPGFGGGEFAFNVFDNQTVGGGNNKWCCNPVPQWVQATFSEPWQLTHFTITSGNDSPGRDPSDWQILGSNDGVNFTVLFSHTGSNIFGNRDEVHLFDAGNFAGKGNVGSDFALGGAYTTFRFQVTGIPGDPSGFQLDELEFFGQKLITPLTPEPTSIALFGLTAVAGGALALNRRRLKRRMIQQSPAA